MLKRGVALLCSASFCASAWAQDPEFSQFYAAPVYLNPAFAGTTVNPKFHINFRDQFPSISHAYVTMAVSYDQYFEDFHSGLGVQLLGDVAGEGIYSTYTILGVYSYQANLSRGFALKFGLHGGMTQKRLDPAKIFYGDQINPITGFYDPGNNINPTTETSALNNTLLHAELGTGFLGYSEYFFFGGSVKHINNPVQTFRSDFTARLPARYTAHIGAAIPFGGKRNDVTLSPNILYTQQASFRQLNAGTYLKSGPVFGGAWFRYVFNNPDAVIITIGAQFGIFRSAYSYDLTLSDLSGHSGGAHEISVTLNLDDLPEAKKSPSAEFLKCPALF